MNKVKAANVGAVFYGGYYAEAAKLVKQLRDAGVEATFVSGDGSLDAKLIEGAGDAAEGAQVSCACNLLTNAEDPDAKAFADAYQAAYGAAPATYSAEGYDAATAFLKAVEAGKTTGDINEFLKTVDFKGLSKQIKFEANGEVAGSVIYIRGEGHESVSSAT